MARNKYREDLILARESGRCAFTQGKPVGENRYDRDANPTKFEAWVEGWWLAHDSSRAHGY